MLLGFVRVELLCKKRKLQTLLEYDGVTLVQETHDDGDSQLLTVAEAARHDYYLYRSWIGTATGGLLTLIPKRMWDLHNFATHIFQELIPGRLTAVVWKNARGGLVMINAHIEGEAYRQEDGKIEFLTILKNFVHGHQEYAIILGGDFNFVLEHCDRVSLKDGSFCGNPGKVGDYWLDNFGSMVELYQDAMTRFPNLKSNAGTACRIDRIYANLPTEAEITLGVSSTTISNVENESPSDHIAVISHIRLKNTSGSSDDIPPHIAESDLFASIVEDMLQNICIDTCVWSLLRLAKRVFRVAAWQVRHIAMHRGATICKERIFWSIQALRAVDVCNRSKFQDAWTAHPGMAMPHTNFDWPVSLSIAEAIRANLVVDFRLEDEEIREEITEAAGDNRYQATRRRQYYLHRISKHCKSNRRIGINAVRDEHGNPCFGSVAVCSQMASYWGKKFEEQPVDSVLAKKFAKRWASAFPATDWTMSFSGFEEMIKKSKKSKPGPDGVPYRAWAASFGSVFLLYSAYLLWLCGAVLPPYFNEAYLWLIPKTDPPDGIFDPNDTRPLSGANTDAKLLAAALAWAFNKSIGEWAATCQRGFIQGRCMLENVIDTESAAVSMSAGNSSAAIILLDFAAAFRSISRAFLWIMLEAIGIPCVIIGAIKQLYFANIHFISNDGVNFFAFCAMAGVRQGCPLSSTIFVLATDAFIRALTSILGPTSMIRVYADDMNVVARDLFALLPQLHYLFSQYACMSGLHLNAKKCIIVPLWSFDEVALQRVVAQLVPLWAEIKIRDCGKYLGFLVGPGSGDKDWERVAAQLIEMAKTIKLLGLPKKAAFSLYHIFAVSKTQFIAQLRAPPEKVLIMEQGALRSIIGGPHNWISPESLCRISDEFNLPFTVRSFAHTSNAAMIRTALFTAVGWKRSHSEMMAAMQHEESFLLHPLHRWVPKTACFQIHQAIEQFDEKTWRASFKGKHRKHAQASIYKFLMKTGYNTHIRQVLCRRLSRWSASREVSLRALRNFTKIKSFMPACVIFAVLNTWLNGWATAKRMQKRSICLLCNDCSSIDAIEHYAFCPAVSTAVRRITRLTLQMDLHHFLLMHKESVECLCLRAAVCYAVRKACISRRNDCRVFPLEANIRVIVNAHKAALMSSRKYMKVYKSALAWC